MNAELNRKTAIKEVLPTAFGYIGIGIAFGIVSKAAGLSALQAGLMSLIASSWSYELDCLRRICTIYYRKYAVST